MGNRLAPRGLVAGNCVRADTIRGGQWRFEAVGTYGNSRATALGGGFKSPLSHSVTGLLPEDGCRTLRYVLTYSCEQVMPVDARAGTSGVTLSGGGTHVSIGLFERRALRSSGRCPHMSFALKSTIDILEFGLFSGS